MFLIRTPAILAALVVLTVLVVGLPAAGQSPEPDSMPPEVITSLTSAGTVDFPHSMHFSDFEIECIACHHETNATALNIPHEEYFEDFWIKCRTCHQAGASATAPQACSACHHSSPTTVADETLSAKVVIHQSCSECHEGGTGQEASRNCGFCHGPETSDAEEGDQHG